MSRQLFLSSRCSVASLAALMSLAGAQTTAPFTDPATGIIFQQFFGARTSFGFGIALPETPTDSFIGQLSFPLSGGTDGWGGFSLTGDMEGPLLMAAWADGGKVVSSFRQAFNEDDNPPEVTGTFSLRPIASGTSVTGGVLTYTFLCEGCLDASLGLGAAATAGTAEMGWALSSRAVRNAASPAGILDFHDSGFGDFEANLAGARNALFDTWAALAGDPVGPGAGAVPIVPDAAGGDSGDEDSGDEDSGDEGGATRGGVTRGGATRGGATRGGATGGGATGGGVTRGGATRGGATTGGGATRGGGSSNNDADGDSDDDD